MAIEINNNTVLRLVVRRGTESDRQLATLAAGELAFTVDTQRLFVGVDGQVGTGVPAGNKFFTPVPNHLLLTQNAQIGDTVCNTTTNCMYQLTAMGPYGGWAVISPALYGTSLEYSTQGTRISPSIAGVGLDLNYTSPRNYYNAVGTLNLDSLFWSLCANASSPTNATDAALYVGNINDNLWTGYDDPGIVSDGAVYVQGGTSQICLSASTTGTSVVFTNSANTTGKTYFTFASAAKFKANAPTGGGLNAISATPGFEYVGGCAVFRNGLVVQGSALIDSLCAQAVYNMALSTLRIDITNNPSLTALTITSESGSTNSVLVNVDSNGHDTLFINSAPFLGMHTCDYGAFSNYWTAISGATINIGPLTVSGAPLTVFGDISATGDIIGFAPSDIALKQNINPISDALEKLLSLKGVEFDWNGKTAHSGHDVGVLAQDVEEVLPSAVSTRHDGFKGVRYDRIIPLIIEAIRELHNSK